jgi:hypothetical protein
MVIWLAFSLIVLSGIVCGIIGWFIGLSQGYLNRMAEEELIDKHPLHKPYSRYEPWPDAPPPAWRDDRSEPLD